MNALRDFELDINIYKTLLTQSRYAWPALYLDIAQDADYMNLIEFMLSTHQGLPYGSWSNIR